MSNVSNLISHFQEIENGQMWVLPRNVHRTYLALQDDENGDMAVWVGENPPTNPDQWFSFGGTDTVDILVLDNGAMGPIYIAENSAGGGGCRAISSVVEPLGTVPAPT